MVWNRYLRTATVALGASLAAGNAHAVWGDRLFLFASETFTYDDNVYRISRGVDPVAAIGSPYRSDMYRTTSVGFNLNVPVSRQRFFVDYSYNDVRYDRFSVLNFSGHQARAQWDWVASDAFDGKIGVTDATTLASLGNVQSGVQSTVPNVVNVRRGFANATWNISPRWRATGEANRLEQSNRATDRQVNDVTVDGAEFTLSYVTPARNSLGLNLRVSDGNFVNRQPVAGILVSNNYRQHAAGVVGEWSPGAHTTLRGRLGRVQREYEQLPQRNFEGNLIDAIVEWRPTVKFTLIAVAQRDISPYEEVTVGLVYVKRIAILPEWRPAEKITLRGVLERSDRDYHGDPGQVLGTVTPITQRVHAVGVTGIWDPYRFLQLQMSLRHESRSANVQFGDYKANIGSVTARVQF